MWPPKKATFYTLEERKKRKGNHASPPKLLRRNDKKGFLKRNHTKSGKQQDIHYPSHDDTKRGKIK